MFVTSQIYSTRSHTCNILWVGHTSMVYLTHCHLLTFTAVSKAMLHVHVLWWSLSLGMQQLTCIALGWCTYSQSMKTVKNSQKTCKNFELCSIYWVCMVQPFIYKFTQSHHIDFPFLLPPSPSFPVLPLPSPSSLLPPPYSSPYLWEQCIETVDFLSLLNIGIVLCHTLQSELIHQVDGVGRRQVAILQLLQCTRVHYSNNIYM